VAIAQASHSGYDILISGATEIETRKIKKPVLPNIEYPPGTEEVSKYFTRINWKVTAVAAKAVLFDEVGETPEAEGDKTLFLSTKVKSLFRELMTCWNTTNSPHPLQIVLISSALQDSQRLLSDLKNVRYLDPLKNRMVSDEKGRFIFEVCATSDLPSICASLSRVFSGQFSILSAKPGHGGEGAQIELQPQETATLTVEITNVPASKVENIERRIGALSGVRYVGDDDGQFNGGRIRVTIQSALSIKTLAALLETEIREIKVQDYNDFCVTCQFKL
jgi:hypothetical protein